MTNKIIKDILPAYGLKLLLTFLMVLLYGLPGFGGELQKITANEIRIQSQEFLTDELSWASDRLDIKIEYRGGDLTLPKGSLDWSFNLPGRKNRIGQVPFQLTLKQDGRILRQLKLQAQVRVTYNLYKTTKPLKRGHTFDLNDVESFQFQSKRLLRNKISNWEQLEGFQLTRNLEEGEMLSIHMVKKVPLVKRGDRIMLIAKRGSLKVTAPGLVRENGFKDQMIKVENMQSHKIVYGTVLNSRTIIVDF